MASMDHSGLSPRRWPTRNTGCGLVVMLRNVNTNTTVVAAAATAGRARSGTSEKRAGLARRPARPASSTVLDRSTMDQ